MQVAIVYESLFGNTHQVAAAVAEGVREAEPAATVSCLAVEDAAPEEILGADLLVVGGPTHMLGMTTHMSRSMVMHGDKTELTEPVAAGGAPALTAEAGAEGPDLRDWFHDLPKAPRGRQAAAFDTRTTAPLAGGAAHGIAHRLRHHGYEVVCEPEGFLIDAAEGPLKDGEYERARNWGAAMASRATVYATEPTTWA
jgi:multimeric flavodoxin WrbA